MVSSLCLNIPLRLELFLQAIDEEVVAEMARFYGTDASAMRTTVQQVFPHLNICQL